jgi:hypothetical protein
MTYDYLYRWRLASMIEPAEVAIERVLNRERSKRDKRAHNQEVYAKQLRITQN